MNDPTTRSKPDAREPFAFERIAVAAGKTGTAELPIARLPAGNWATLPVVISHGKRPGPTVWLNGAIHGDELNGIAIARRCATSIRPRELSGTLITVPAVNVFGVAVGSRYLPDRRDLNRCFPGSARGSMAGRLADLFFNRVVSRCSFGIDVHSGSNGRDNLMHVRGNLDDPLTRRCAEAFGAPLAMHAPTRGGSLRAAAGRRGKPVLVVEVGEALRIDPRSIADGVAGVRRTLACLGLLPAQSGEAPLGLSVSRRSNWVRASRSGFCLVEVGLGEHVSAGQRVASIMDTVGAKDVIIRTRTAGVVISILRTALVHRGDALVHIAEVAP